MKENTEEKALRRGYFPLRLTVEDQNSSNATTTLAQFIEKMSCKYDLQIICQPLSSGSDRPHHAEAVVAVPFPEKENIRIDFNVFASEVEDECGDASRYYFYMESCLQT